jgi:hypothetical protein
MSREIVPNVEGGFDKVQTVDGIVVTDGFYDEQLVRNGMLYRRYHDLSPREDDETYPTDGKFVPIDSFVPDGMKYGPDDPSMVSGIRLLNDTNISTLDAIYGDKTDGVSISRYLTEEDCEDLTKEKLKRGTFDEDMNFLKARLELDEQLTKILGDISLSEYQRITNLPSFISPSE